VSIALQRAGVGLCAAEHWLSAPPVRRRVRGRGRDQPHRGAQWIALQQPHPPPGAEEAWPDTAAPGGMPRQGLSFRQMLVQCMATSCCYHFCRQHFTTPCALQQAAAGAASLPPSQPPAYAALVRHAAHAAAASAPPQPRLPDHLGAPGGGREAPLGQAADDLTFNSTIKDRLAGTVCVRVPSRHRVSRSCWRRSTSRHVCSTRPEVWSQTPR
jgi:hypothetical protein